MGNKPVSERTELLHRGKVVKGMDFENIYGLGGRDVKVESIEKVFDELKKITDSGIVGDTYRYLDVRE